MINRKCLSSILLFGTLLFVGCSKKEEPVSLNKANVHVALYTREFVKRSNELDGIIKSALTKGTLTEKDQIELYAKLKREYDNLNELCERQAHFSSYLPEAGVPLRLNSNHLAWYSLLKTNLHGFDFGTPELEKYAQRDNRGFKVHSVYSTSERASVEALENICDSLSK